jgi:hypothetical protein
MYIYLDESGDTGFKFRQGSSRYFVVALLLVDDPIPLHQEIHESHRDNLLQVVDMVAGAIARTYEGGDGRYQQIIRKKIKNIWLFPRQ